MRDLRLRATRQTPSANRARIEACPRSLETMARDSIERHTRILIHAGLSRADISRALLKVAESVLKDKDTLRQELSTPARPPPRREVTLAPQVLAEWCTDPKYADAEGRPLKLPIRGRRSVATLVRRINRSLDVERVLQQLVHTGTVERCARRYRVTRRWVYSRGSVTPSDFWGLRALDQTLRTIEHNTHYEIMAPWFHRIAERADVPARKLPEIDRLLERRGMAFLDWFDAYLHRCAAEKKAGEPTVWCGIGLQRYQYDTSAHEIASRSRGGSRRKLASRPKRRAGAP